MKYKYSAYCTCFYTPERHEVCIWDEMRNRVLQVWSAFTAAEARRIMENWKAAAPTDCICEILK